MLTGVCRRVLPLAWTAVVMAAPQAGASQSLRAVPLDHWAYDVAEELLLRHPALGVGLWLGNRPWREADFHTLLARADSAGLGDTDRRASASIELMGRAFPERAPAVAEVAIHNEASLWLTAHASRNEAAFDPSFLGVRFEESDGDPPIPALRGVLQHDFAVQYRDRFALGWRYAIDSDVTGDPTRFRQLEAREDTDYGFALLDAYAVYGYGPLRVTAGRNELWLGQAGRSSSVFVSDSIPPIDQVRIDLVTRTLRFTGLIGRLSGDEQNRSLDEHGETIPGSMPPPAGERRDVDRIFYLHRVDWQPADYIQVAISEAAFVTGIDRGLDARYANLLIPFFVTQEDEDESGGVDVNVMVDVEGVLLVPRGARIWANVFVQEFFIDADKRENIGNQLAYKAGAEMAGDALGLPAITAGVEYTRVDVFSYLHRGLNTNHTQFGVPIGSSLGPDADMAQGWISWRPWPNLRLTVDAMMRRDGERGVETLESVIDAGHPDFPSGVVQRERRLGVEGWGLLPGHGVEGLLRVSAHDLTDIEHDPGREGTFWTAEVGLRVRHLFASSGPRVAQ
ncbi:MAG TPA: capsule assembly Wzi family protein [Gemmatimonadota bacterium]|nr:capsule assembly Wzi family protein [Gemmatimonadota bacterium]